MSKINIFALGGLNEKGKNMYVVEVDKDIYVFEAGLKYASDDLLGIDYIIPSFDYLLKNKKIQCSHFHHQKQISSQMKYHFGNPFSSNHIEKDFYCEYHVL